MKGILFKPWKIKAIADSSPDFEWQTRRLDGLKEINQEPDGWTCLDLKSGRYYFEIPETITCHLLIKPRYQVGEVAYIKEAHYKYGYWLQTSGRGKEFQITSDEVKFLENPPAEILTSAHLRLGWYKRSPLFLFEKDTRYFIKILSVRPE